MKHSRRQFIKNTGLAVGSAALIGTAALSCTSQKKKYVDSLGFQVWTVKDKVFEDLPGTLSRMNEMGYDHFEMCSPLGYKGSGFGPLNKYSGKELKSMITDTGLDCFSSHFTMDELKNNLDDRIEWSLQMGLSQMMLSCFWWGVDASVDEYRKAANELNVIAEQINKAGLQAGFHNHHMEFETKGGELIYDAIMEELDPDLVKMQFQVAVINIGYKAADYFRKYPGRFVSAHLADWSKPQDSMVPVGHGEVDWNEFFEAAKIGGVENFYVEMAEETFADSAKFLKS